MRDALDFIDLAAGHLAVLHRWLNEDPVLRWYAREPKSLAQVEEQYGATIDGSVPTRGFILWVDGKPAGFWQTYRIDAYPDYARQIAAEPDWCGMDFFIGDAAARGRGLAARAHVLFCERHAPTGVVVAGPDPENRASIRSLAGAGFVPLRTVEIEPGEFELLMSRRKSRQAVS